MNDAPETFNEYAIYEQIFQIFEIEFQEIGRFVAFTDANACAHSTKIHELHLRVCSEVENVLKLIVHEHFLAKDDVNKRWADQKASFLEKKGVRSEYESLSKKLNKRKGKELDKLLFGYPDFAFYYQLACDSFHLDQKRVTFKAGISDGNRWENMVPFALQKKDDAVPLWWTNYNRLKHDKVEWFSECTLIDLGNAMGALYILMNYLIVYQSGNERIQNPDYTRFRMNGGKPPQNDPPFCDYKSNFFDATCLAQNVRLADMLQESLTVILFNTLPAKFVRPLSQQPNEQAAWSPEEWQALQKPLNDADLDSVMWGKLNGDPAEHIYYGFVAYEEIPLSETNDDPHCGLAHFAKFCN